MYTIIERRMIVPNMHEFTVRAPAVAESVQPGNFVIVRPDALGERIPLSVADWDREAGTVTSIFMQVGGTTAKLARLKPGDIDPDLRRTARQGDRDRHVRHGPLRRRLLRDRLDLPHRPGAQGGRQPGLCPHRGAELVSPLLGGQAVPGVRQAVRHHPGRDQGPEGPYRQDPRAHGRRRGSSPTG